MKKSPDILATIIQQKQQEVAQLKQQYALDRLQLHCRQQEQPRDFIGAIKKQLAQQQIAIIAEIKKASPSKGVIRKEFKPAEIAASYQQGGATCLSVLTDETFFQGNNDDLIAAKQACQLPILRKDFIISLYQIYQARAIGADCILLIVAALNDEDLHQFHDLAVDLGIAVLVESHNLEELKRALPLSTPLIGINNRDLRTFEVDLEHCVRLRKEIPEECLVVGESGIYTHDDVALLAEAGIDAILVGESLMRSEDIEAAVLNLLRG